MLGTRQWKQRSSLLVRLDSDPWKIGFVIPDSTNATWAKVTQHIVWGPVQTPILVSPKPQPTWQSGIRGLTTTLFLHKFGFTFHNSSHNQLPSQWRDLVWLGLDKMLSQSWPFCLWSFSVVSKGHCFLGVIHQFWLLQYFHPFFDSHSCATESRNKYIPFMSGHLPISYSMHAGPSVGICIVYHLLQMRASRIRIKQYPNLWVLWKTIRSWFICL